EANQFRQVYLRFQVTIASQGKFYAASKDSRVSPVDVRDIAAVAVAALTGTGHEGKKYVITGPEALTYFDVADKLSAAIGKKVSYVDVPLEARSRQSWIPERPPGLQKARRNSSDSVGRASNPVLHRRSRMSPGRNRHLSKTSRESTPRIFAARQISHWHLGCRPALFPKRSGKENLL